YVLYDWVSMESVLVKFSIKLSVGESPELSEVLSAKCGEVYMDGGVVDDYK
ncbi:hypothetical protein Tco_1339644, partial [Tanacetum coccineum]